MGVASASVTKFPTAPLTVQCTQLLCSNRRLTCPERDFLANFSIQSEYTLWKHDPSILSTGTRNTSIHSATSSKNSHLPRLKRPPSEMRQKLRNHASMANQPSETLDHGNAGSISHFMERERLESSSWTCSHHKKKLAESPSAQVWNKNVCWVHPKPCWNHPSAIRTWLDRLDVGAF